MTPLMLAAAQGKIDILNTLLFNYAAVDEQDKCGGTALMKAAMYGHYDCVVAIINAKCLLGLEVKITTCFQFLYLSHFNSLRMLKDILLFYWL